MKGVDAYVELHIEQVGPGLSIQWSGSARSGCRSQLDVKGVDAYLQLHIEQVGPGQGVWDQGSGVWGLRVLGSELRRPVQGTAVLAQAAVLQPARVHPAAQALNPEPYTCCLSTQLLGQHKAPACCHQKALMHGQS